MGRSVGDIAQDVGIGRPEKDVRRTGVGDSRDEFGAWCVSAAMEHSVVDRFIRAVGQRGVRRDVLEHGGRAGSAGVVTDVLIGGGFLGVRGHLVGAIFEWRVVSGGELCDGLGEIVFLRRKERVVLVGELCLLVEDAGVAIKMPAIVTCLILHVRRSRRACRTWGRSVRSLAPRVGFEVRSVRIVFACAPHEAAPLLVGPNTRASLLIQSVAPVANARCFFGHEVTHRLVMVRAETVAAGSSTDDEVVADDEVITVPVVGVVVVSSSSAGSPIL